MQNDFDEIYRDQPEYFGAKRSSLIERFVTEVPSGCRVLDLGIGQGRNALAMLRRGVYVTGVDSSKVAIRKLDTIAREENLPLSLWYGSFVDFKPELLPHGSSDFDVIMAFGLLQVLSRSDGASLIYRLGRWTRPGGTLLLNAWHVDDPSYAEYRAGWTEIGLHSFRGADDQVRTFLARDEILDLLPGWTITYHHEGFGAEHSHGDGSRHHHGNVEVVASRNG